MSACSGHRAGGGSTARFFTLTAEMAEGASMLDLLKQFWADDSGQGLTEYASIVALVSVALIAVLIAFRGELGRIYNDMRAELNSEIGSINQAAT